MIPAACLTKVKPGQPGWTAHILTHNLPPYAQTKLDQVLYNAQLLISQGNYFIQNALYILQHGRQHGYRLRTCPILVRETNWDGMDRI